jgi:hypothetical protein
MRLLSKDWIDEYIAFIVQISGVKLVGRLSRHMAGLRWAVPRTARIQIVSYHRDNDCPFGSRKDVWPEKRKYCLPRIERYIRRYVFCLACMYTNESAGKRPGIIRPIPKFDVPLRTIHVDHLGPFVLNTWHHAYLIEAIDGSGKTIQRDHDTILPERRDLLQVCTVNNKEANSYLIDGLMVHTLRNGAKPGLLCMGTSIGYRQMRHVCCCRAVDESRFELRQILLSWF